MSSPNSAAQPNHNASPLSVNSNQMSSTKGRTPRDACIFRVPKSIRTSKPEAYKPLVVSIGPYHHHPKSKLKLSDHKEEALQRTLRRLNIDKNSLHQRIMPLESRIRKCYQDSANELDANTLVETVTLDACFLLEFLRGKEPPPATSQEDMSLVLDDNEQHNIIRSEIMHDILKLENQIPLFVLVEILQVEVEVKMAPTVAPNPEEKALPLLVNILTAFDVFRGFPLCNDKEILAKNIARDPNTHLLGLCGILLKSFLQQSNTAGDDREDYMPIPSAQKLYNAGIRFKKSEGGEIRFEQGRWGISHLYLPKIVVDDNTEDLLRNIMALEECLACKSTPRGDKSCDKVVSHYVSHEECLACKSTPLNDKSCDKVVSHYVRLMDDLIDSDSDVGLLEKKEVVRNLMGSEEEIVGMFNGVCKGITIRKWGVYSGVARSVRKHYDSRWKVWISEFRHLYVSKPWHVVAVLAAFLQLAMTAVQTYYAAAGQGDKKN